MAKETEKQQPAALLKPGERNGEMERESARLLDSNRQPHRDKAERHHLDVEGTGVRRELTPWALQAGCDGSPCTG